MPCIQRQLGQGGSGRLRELGVQPVQLRWVWGAAQGEGNTLPPVGHMSPEIPEMQNGIQMAVSPTSENSAETVNPILSSDIIR